MNNKPIILFAVLHWGLGHITRSLPIIHRLREKGYRVIICSDGLVLDYLCRDFPDLETEKLPSYDIRYEARSMAKNVVFQLPKILTAFLSEKSLFHKLVDRYRPKLIISDNRYGCLSKSVPSFFLGHQWSILNKHGKKHRLASAINQFFIKKFDKMIIPDNDQHQFSGHLSKFTPTEFSICTGILSRFNTSSYIQEKKKYKALILLSGPEPARTLLESKIIQQLTPLRDHNFLLIRGTNTPFIDTTTSHIEVLDLVSKHDLKQYLLDSAMVISRSGYSSLMDYIRLGIKQMILIPTTGQTEQEYLAQHFRKQFGTVHLKEENVEQLSTVLQKIKSTSIPEGSSLGINALIEQLEDYLLESS